MTVLRPKPGGYRPLRTAPHPETFKPFTEKAPPGYLDGEPITRAELEAGAKKMRKDHNRTSWTRTCENIIERFRAGDSVRLLAFDYRLTETEVEEVIRAFTGLESG